MAYKTQGVTTKISATSRMSIHLKDNYYTIEATEERALPNNEIKVNVEEEYKALFDSVNGIVDDQMQEILNTFK